MCEYIYVQERHPTFGRDIITINLTGFITLQGQLDSLPVNVSALWMHFQIHQRHKNSELAATPSLFPSPKKYMSTFGLSQPYTPPKLGHGNKLLNVYYCYHYWSSDSNNCSEDNRTDKFYK